MLRNSIVCVVALFPLAFFGCGGSSQKTAENKNDSSSETPNRNSGGADQGQTKQTDNSTKTAQASNITFSKETGLPSDFPLPECLTYVGIRDMGPQKWKELKSTKSGEETVELLKNKLSENGWKFMPFVDGFECYKSSQDISKLHPRKYPKDTRIYMVQHDDRGRRTRSRNEKLTDGFLIVFAKMEPLKDN